MKNLYINRILFIKRIVTKSSVLALCIFLLPVISSAQENKALNELQDISRGNAANIETSKFSLPAAPQRESLLIKKLQNIPWQENGAITENIGAADKLFGFGKPAARFEGWYTRITDTDGQRTFAFVVGSFKSADSVFSKQQFMPGYIAVLVSNGKGETLKVYETFPENTTVSVNGVNELNQSPLKECFEGKDCWVSDFSWSAEGYGFVNNKGFSLEIPDEINIKGNFGAPVYWNGDRNGSPEGFVTDIALVPIHWYVHSLGSPTKYEYNIIDENISVKSFGYAHIEKNWGRSFPSKWIWSEGITDNNGSQYAFAGGEIDMGAFKMTAFLAGIRTPKISWDFKPQQGTVFKSHINACDGSFALILSKPGKKLIIESGAAGATFGKVSIPTPNGFVKGGGVESFSATTTIEAYKVNVLGIHKLVERKVFENAALEFGANYMCGGFDI